jgi:hypothetical protein
MRASTVNGFVPKFSEVASGTWIVVTSPVDGTSSPSKQTPGTLPAGVALRDVARTRLESLWLAVESR